MSISSSSNQINKIHINSSTKISLSDRFTAFSAQPKINQRTTRQGIESPVSRAASIANRRLLKQLAQKHTMEAALKLKRRSMKARPQPTAAYKRVTNGQPLKRGTIKALRLGPSGKLLKANSITDVATMEADFLGQRSSRRSNSISRLADRVGGRARRGRAGVRPIWGAMSQLNSIRDAPQPVRMRSRSRSRNQAIVQDFPQQGVSGRLARGRSRSRSRQTIRSRSRSRIDRINRLVGANVANSVPITSRLGTRPGAPLRKARSRSRAGSRVDRRRIQGGIASGRIASGRILKRRNSGMAKNASVATGNVQSRLSRPKGRLPPSAVNQRLSRSDSKRGKAPRGRARSRSRAENTLQRKNIVPRGNAGVANRQRNGSQRGRATVRNIGRRGRSQQRGGPKRNGNVQQQQQQQPRLGRSRSRGRANTRNGRQLGSDKADVKKEDLDKELDQYMSSTKSSNDLFS